MAKILVSIDDKLLRRIDRAARSAGLSRSAYLARLAASEVGSRQGPGSDRKVRRTLARLDRLFERRGIGEESTAAVRASRDAR
jgi:hypothetical protein